MSYPMGSRPGTSSVPIVAQLPCCQSTLVGRSVGQCGCWCRCRLRVSARRVVVSCDRHDDVPAAMVNIDVVGSESVNVWSMFVRAIVHGRGLVIDVAASVRYGGLAIVEVQVDY